MDNLFLKWNWVMAFASCSLAHNVQAVWWEARWLRNQNRTELHCMHWPRLLWTLKARQWRHAQVTVDFIFSNMVPLDFNSSPVKSFYLAIDFWIIGCHPQFYMARRMVPLSILTLNAVFSRTVNASIFFTGWPNYQSIVAARVKVTVQLLWSF